MRLGGSAPLEGTGRDPVPTPFGQIPRTITAQSAPRMRNGPNGT